MEQYTVSAADGMGTRFTNEDGKNVFVNKNGRVEIDEGLNSALTTIIKDEKSGNLIITRGKSNGVLPELVIEYVPYKDPSKKDASSRAYIKRIECGGMTIEYFPKADSDYSCAITLPKIDGSGIRERIEFKSIYDPEYRKWSENHKKLYKQDDLRRIVTLYSKATAAEGIKGNAFKAFEDDEKDNAPVQA